MVSAAFQQLESLLRARHLDRTLARPWLDLPPPVAPTGQASLDEALGGGWRRGEISEIVGGRSSGRTSLMTAALAAATARGEVVGLVDACDRFDPAGAAARGLDLSRVLWIRGANVTVASAAPQLIDTMLRRALRAFDLLIRAGGFGLAVLDLADVPARWLNAVPKTSWLRVAHANEGRDTAGLVLADAAVSRSARGATVRVSATWRWAGGDLLQRRMTGLDLCAQVGTATLGAGRNVRMAL